MKGEAKVPSAVFRITKLGEYGKDMGWGWYKVKMLEDDGEILSGVMTALHDSDTGTLFLGGAGNDSISFCKKRDGGFNEEMVIV